jgi:2-aminoadipate transaminase
MKELLANSYKNTEPSFVSTILSAAADPSVISFAGGLPNPASFPVKEFKESANRIIDTLGPTVFQYGKTEGVYEFRDYLAGVYNKKYGLDLDADNFVITTGSQQALDCFAKVFIDDGDGILVENPSYLGALQAFDQYCPAYYPVDLKEDGLDIDQLEDTLKKHGDKIKLAYLIPEFQNPTGLTYTAENRAKVTEILSRYNVILIEDDPYGQLRFEGVKPPYVGLGKLENAALLGTFSKVATPGMRVGYIISENKEITKYMGMAVEASALHTNTFAQYLLLDYLTHNDQPAHVKDIQNLYRSQCHAMLDAMDRYFPSSCTFTRPQGGMFIWATLPEGVSALKIFPKAVEKKVVFVPGDPFYVNVHDANTMRLNFTNASPEKIEEGIKNLGDLLKEVCGD